MRYRTLSPTGDMTFGNSAANFLVNSPDAVAQAVMTRLKLMEGEWFLDITEGTPYASKILGTGKQSTYDAAIKNRILTTPGVKSILSYSSSYDGTTRKLSVNATIDTIYGQTSITPSL